MNAKENSDFLVDMIRFKENSDFLIDMIRMRRDGRAFHLRSQLHDCLTTAIPSNRFAMKFHYSTSQWNHT